MRLDNIELTWFRGAADLIQLTPKSKSMILYGENGSGKSSFIDAIEYVIKKGRIEHLAHEYSGKHQEKGILNTHIPAGKKAEIRIGFKDGSQLSTIIAQNGTFTTSGNTAGVDSWAYQRTILRQDEIAAFIQDTKLAKYSTLLPLLGFGHLEIAAENLRQLVKSIEKESKIKDIQDALKVLDAKRETVFNSDSDEQILERIKSLHSRYCSDKIFSTEQIAFNELEAALTERIAQFSEEQKKYNILKETGELRLSIYIDTVKKISLKLASTIEPLITERLEVLKSATTYVEKLTAEKRIKCPSCGQLIDVEAFQLHIITEETRLKENIAVFNEYKAAKEQLMDVIKILKYNLGKTEIEAWCKDLSFKQGFAEKLTFLNDLKIEQLRSSCTQEHISEIEDSLLPVISAAAATSATAPPEIQELTTDKTCMEVGKAILESSITVEKSHCTDALIYFIKELEHGIREEIRRQSQKAIDEISSDIRVMWSILHPDEIIEEVRLYVPEDSEKAIDIGLKFYGVEQDSPKLTLSEGHKNSLGLCIFLAMAKREASKDIPLFLDDVVSSFDRGHRGMIVELLKNQFENRQIIIFTHDRDWYIELRRQLEDAKWTYKSLKPYDNPEIGIRLSDRTWTLDDARAKLKEEPDSAGNTARKIMDIELAVVAEGLKLKLHYLHRERNDHRVAHDFLTRLISDGGKCFKKKDITGKEYEPYTPAIETLREADKLLTSWGNKASHTFDAVKNEAEKLIEICENALEKFTCPLCEKRVDYLENEKTEFVQCGCGNLKWQYGKA